MEASPTAHYLPFTGTFTSTSSGSSPIVFANAREIIEKYNKANVSRIHNPNPAYQYRLALNDNDFGHVTTIDESMKRLEISSVVGPQETDMDPDQLA